MEEIDETIPAGEGTANTVDLSADAPHKALREKAEQKSTPEQYAKMKDLFDQMDKAYDDLNRRLKRKFMKPNQKFSAKLKRVLRKS